MTPAVTAVVGDRVGPRGSGETLRLAVRGLPDTASSRVTGPALDGGHPALPTALVF